MRLAQVAEPYVGTLKLGRYRVKFVTLMPGEIIFILQEGVGEALLGPARPIPTLIVMRQDGTVVHDVLITELKCVWSV